MDLTSIVVAAITGILTGGLASTIVSNALSRRWAKKDIQRQKLEDLFLSFSKYVTGLRGYWWRYWYMARGQTTIGDVARQLKEDEETPPTSFDKARMLAHIYFPDVLEHFQKLIELRNEGSRAVVQMDKIHLNGLMSSEHEAKFKDLIHRADEIETLMGQIIRERAASIAR